MVSSPPTGVGYVEDRDRYHLSLTTVGNSTVEGLGVGDGSYLLTEGQARILLSQLRSVLPEEDEEA